MLTWVPLPGARLTFTADGGDGGTYLVGPIRMRASTGTDYEWSMTLGDYTATYTSLNDAKTAAEADHRTKLWQAYMSANDPPIAATLLSPQTAGIAAVGGTPGS